MQMPGLGSSDAVSRTRSRLGHTSGLRREPPSGGLGKSAGARAVPQGDLPWSALRGGRGVPGRGREGGDPMEKRVQRLAEEEGAGRKGGRGKGPRRRLGRRRKGAERRDRWGGKQEEGKIEGGKA